MSEPSEGQGKALREAGKPFELGSFVYPPYEPVKVGVIVAREVKSLPHRRAFWRYTVRRPNGEEWTAEQVSSFDKLVEDHRRKLANHEATLVKLRAVEVPAS